MRCRDIVLAALLASAAGCAHNPDPRPRSMAAVQSDAHGGFAVVKVDDKVEVQGELIAIDAADVWVLDGAYLIRTPLATVTQLVVYSYDVSQGGVATTGVVGTISTLSHGFFLLFSAPAWIVTTSIVAAVHSREPRAVGRPGTFDSLAQWARFPQGMPDGLTATELWYGRRPPPKIGPPGMAPAAPAAAPPQPAPAPPVPAAPAAAPAPPAP